MVVHQIRYSLKDNNTFRMNERCRDFVIYDDECSLCNFISNGGLKESKFMSLGCGSNILFRDYYDGIILHSGIKECKVTDEDDTYVYVKAGSGMIWDDFVSLTVEKNWWGAENLSYIPGTIGASAVQNIGAYGTEAKDIIYKVRMVSTETGKTKEVDALDCSFRYRGSKFKDEWKDKYIVTYITYRLKKHPSPNLSYGGLSNIIGDKKPTLKDIRDTIISIRKDKLPEVSEYGSAGSYFTNPIISKKEYEKLKSWEEFKNIDIPHYDLEDDKVKIPAGWMIDYCGLKGYRDGQAGIWNKQALVIVNYGGASSEDVLEIANHIRREVFNRFNITLIPEVIYV